MNPGVLCSQQGPQEDATEAGKRHDDPLPWVFVSDRSVVGPPTVPSNVYAGVQAPLPAASVHSSEDLKTKESYWMAVTELKTSCHNSESHSFGTYIPLIDGNLNPQQQPR